MSVELKWSGYKWCEIDNKRKIQCSELRCSKCGEILLKEYLVEDMLQVKISNCDHFVWLEFGNEYVNQIGLDRLRKQYLMKVEDGESYYFLKRRD